MNILLVTPDYPPNCGGGGVVAMHLAQGLVNKGHKVSVLAGSYDIKNKIHYEENNGVKIIWIPLMHILIELKIPQLIYSLPPSLKSIYFLKQIDYNQYDVIHLFAFPTHLLVDIVNIISNNKKIILTIHAFPEYVSKEGPASYIIKSFYKFYLKTLGWYIINKSQTITTISHSTAKAAIQLGIPKNKLKIIPNGIEIKKYVPSDLTNFNKKYNISEKDLLILSIGRITWHKGFEYSLIAMKQIFDAAINIKYIIIGDVIDDTYYTKLKKITSDLDIENTVIFSGYVDESTKISALSRCSIYLAPSLHEGFGLTILEAMAMGKSIIATNVSGHKDILEHMKTAIMISTKNPNEITQSVKKLVANDTLANYLGNNCKNQIKKFDWSAIIEKYYSSYKEVNALR